jgi:hypothetical protein
MHKFRQKPRFLSSLQTRIYISVTKVHTAAKGSILFFDSEINDVYSKLSVGDASSTAVSFSTERVEELDKHRLEMPTSSPEARYMGRRGGPWTSFISA